VIAADNHLYCYTEDDGTVVLADASPAGWKEHGRFTIPRKSALRKMDTKIWTHPVIADGRLYLRDQELIFCYQIR
jgi:outer membrane protein assembly factor BamB